jgi:hypothetical protein
MSISPLKIEYCTLSRFVAHGLEVAEPSLEKATNSVYARAAPFAAALALHE